MHVVATGSLNFLIIKCLHLSVFSLVRTETSAQAFPVSTGTLISPGWMNRNVSEVAQRCRSKRRKKHPIEHAGSEPHFWAAWPKQMRARVLAPLSHIEKRPVMGLKNVTGGWNLGFLEGGSQTHDQQWTQKERCRSSGFGGMKNHSQCQSTT